MAALTADRLFQKLGVAEDKRLNPLATASVQFYKGGMVCRVNSTGLVSPASQALAATDYVCGVCVEHKDAVTASGDTVEILADGIYKFAQDASITQAMVGELCYVVDDQTVTEDSLTGTPPIAGVIYQVDSDGVWVRINYLPSFPVAVDPSP